MFSKKPAEMAASRSAGGGTFSLLGADTTVHGDLSASSDLHIDGRVEGDVACPGLVQGEGSEIVGAVTAETARLGGRVRGSIRARELVILKSARIEGDVQYEVLTIEPGAQVDGHFTPRHLKPGSAETQLTGTQLPETQLIVSARSDVMLPLAERQRS